MWGLRDEFPCIHVYLFADDSVRVWTVKNTHYNRDTIRSWGIGKFFHCSLSNAFMYAISGHILKHFIAIVLHVMKLLTNIRKSLCMKPHIPSSVAFLGLLPMLAEGGTYRCYPGAPHSSYRPDWRNPPPPNCSPDWGTQEKTWNQKLGGNNRFGQTHACEYIRIFPKQHKSDISVIFVQNWHRGVSKSPKIKLPSLGIELTTPTIYGLKFQLPY